MVETLLRQDTTIASAYANLGDGLAAAEAVRVQGDNSAVLRILAELRERFPEHAAPFLRAIAILSQLRRFDEVEPLLAEGAARFPNDPAFAIERAWLAYRRGDFTAAIERWREIRTAMPTAHAGYTAGAIALRDARRFAEADALLADAVERFPNDPAPRTEYAWLAAAQRDWPEAVRRWASVREHFPDLEAGYLRGAQALSALWQHEAAETLLTEAMARFPQDPAIACDHAWVAYHRHQLDVAAQRFEEVRRRFPDVVTGYTGAATVLRDQFRITEAEAVLEEAQRRFPDEPRLLYEHARLLLFHPLRRERDPEEAMRRTERLLAAFPFFDDGYLLGIRTLRELGRPEEADELAQIGAGILPQSAAIALEHGHNARQRGDWPEAIWRYGAVRQRFPDHAGGSIGLAAALSSSGRHAEAEQVLKEAMQRFPADPAVLAEFGQIAVRQEHWAEALGRWREAQKRFPDAKEFAHRIFEAELRLADSQPGENAPAPVAEPVPLSAAQPEPDSDPRESTRNLVMQFESLGGTGLGCEFGMFQREFGAEPLGLFRWADMPYDGIISVLENRFDGVGAPEHTELFVGRENSRPEYCTRDRRGFMFMRAFVYEDEMPYERMEKQALRRLGFLKQKLIGDLESGGKIFVYRLTARNLEPAELARLHRAVRGYGDNMLLYVRYEDPEHPNGTVELAAPGLMIGYIDRFKMGPDGQLTASPPSASWLKICQNAYELRSTSKVAAQIPPAVAIEPAGAETELAPLPGERLEEMRTGVLDTLGILAGTDKASLGNDYLHYYESFSANLVSGTRLSISSKSECSKEDL